MFVIIGLGNPGAEYAATYHNTGFRVIDALAEKWGTSLDRKRCKSMIAECHVKGERVALCQPQTYMNLSGEAVIQLTNWYKCDLNEVLIVYDDIDLPLGKLRFRTEGSAGTHNGMRNIIQLAGRSDIPRLRVGIGRPAENMELMDFVLAKPREGAVVALNQAISQAAQAIDEYVVHGINALRVFIGKQQNNE